VQNGRGERGFAVVNVADGADVDVWFATIECFCHGVVWLCDTPVNHQTSVAVVCSIGLAVSHKLGGFYSILNIL
jgi:hypothetical protein